MTLGYKVRVILGYKERDIRVQGENDIRVQGGGDKRDPVDTHTPPHTQPNSLQYLIP